MSDITELAQREKFEAWWEREYKHLESSKYTDAVPHIKYGFWMAYQAGGAELVEALEKAQGMEAYWKAQCRGITDHCEELQARIAELESRAVTVKLPQAVSAGGQGYQGQVERILTAAGIKVEAE
ncbi:TPA: hypothetical protein ACGFAM_000737 [Klebsiella pneumoniae]